ncbi:hypothetical protein VTK73DRAFT_161 [Phialemonium thermophilum]|uniref:Uncharacterized protein n=1 Tax=Phialemonium thermophilum TaxID=223376 RepID=A0ABR3VWP0_9PEZI
MFESKGDKLLSSFGDLWDILVSAATGDPTREIVCILDALDECTGSERDQLIHAIRRFYSNTSVRTPTLKFLLTSRPYLDIKVGFQELTGRTPTIHLSGENEEEADKICREIDLVVDSRIAKMDRLAEKERAVLRKEMAGVTNRTYLWVHLVLEEVGKAILLSPTKIRSAVRNIPRTVDEAYERILSKSRDAQLAKKLLHIIVAAARPLTLREMSVALALDHTHRSFSDLELPPEARFREDVRELCGQFVVVLDSKIYLLHQTAREFLVHPPSLSIPPGSTTLRWKFALHPRESNRILSEICVLRLSLPGSSLQDRRKKRGWEDYAAEPTLFEYAAKFWDDHFRGSDWEASDTMMMKEVVSLFDPNLPAYSKWFTRYQGFPPLMAASYLGLGVVVQAMLAQPGADPNARDETGSTALHWALDHYDEILVRHLLDAAADSNMRDKNSMTPLHYACKQGSVAVQQHDATSLCLQTG